jgi:hypothetical protein
MGTYVSERTYVEVPVFGPIFDPAGPHLNGVRMIDKKDVSKTIPTRDRRPPLAIGIQ